MNLLFTFSDATTRTSAFLTDGAKITECYYNNLKSADNSASFKIPYDEVLCDKLKAEINKNVKVQIIDNAIPIFTGYVRKNISFQKTQRNQPFQLELVSPAILLDVNYSGNTINYSNTNLSAIVDALLSFTNFSGTINTSAIASTQIPLFQLTDGENIEEVLDVLLYEFGYCYNFDNNGNFYITTIFNQPSTITQHFNGDNCLNSIDQQVKNDEYKNVEIAWSKVEQESEVLIFEDTTNGDSNNPANIQIDANSYYLGVENNELNYDSKFPAIMWIQSARDEITFSDNSGITKTFTNQGDKGLLSIHNSSTTKRLITKLQVYGSGFFKIADNKTKSGSDGKKYSYSAKYIQTDAQASYLAKKLVDYYNYSNFTTVVTSKTKYDVGTFVDVSDIGIGTVVNRIVKRVWNIKLNQYVYTLESVTEYTPVENYTRTQRIGSRLGTGVELRDAVNDLNIKVDGIKTETTMCSADITSVIIRLDNDGKTISAQDVTTTISLKQSDQDLDFTIGNIQLPEGWTYTVSGKQVTFHIGEGISLRSGQFPIPIQYRTVIAEYQYVDEDGNMYVDENGTAYRQLELSSSYTQWNIYFTYFGENLGVYLYGINSLSAIPSNANYGDFFTWTGENTASSLSYDGQFLQGRVYKYVGTSKSYQWEQDTNAGHNQQALSDVLGIANADLEHNNSTVYEYLDHLTANSIYADMIVANEVFVNKVTSAVVSAGNLVTVNVLDDEIAQAEIDAMNNTLADLGVSSLADHTIISGGKIKTDLINASAIAIGDLSGYSTLKSDVDSKASATSVTNIINGTTAIEMQNAKVNGVTLIQNGYIKTDFLSADVVTSNYLEGGNAKFSGSITSADVHALKGLYSKVYQGLSFNSFISDISNINIYGAGDLIATGKLWYRSDTSRRITTLDICGATSFTYSANYQNLKYKCFQTVANLTELTPTLVTLVYLNSTDTRTGTVTNSLALYNGYVNSWTTYTQATLLETLTSSYELFRYLIHI